MSGGAPVVDRDVSKLAPKFHLMIAQGLEECHRAGLDAIVWEACRSNELQMLYYLRGRPPSIEYPAPVTNAKTNLYSWHGYGLAVDIISQKDHWFAPDPKQLGQMIGDARRAYIESRRREGERWFSRMAQIMKRHGCDWGGDWTPAHSDPPHIQFGGLKATPSDRARELILSGGVEAIWRAVNAV